MDDRGLDHPEETTTETTANQQQGLSVPQAEGGGYREGSGGSYAETLKMVKEQVAGDGDGWVEATRRTRSGDLLIMTKDRGSGLALNQKVGA